MLGFVLEGSHGRMIANKEREWAHIGYWRRQDTIIGLNCSTPPQTETPMAAPAPWLVLLKLVVPMIDLLSPDLMPGTLARGPQLGYQQLIK